MALERSRARLRRLARLLDERLEAIPDTPRGRSIEEMNAADEDVPAWWLNPSLACIGLVECRTFGRGRRIREWLD